MTQYVLALDQGTTSSRAIVFAHDGTVVASAQQEFRQILTQPGHVEHDGEDIWQSQLQVAREALANAELDASQLAAVGIANQRETTILWERDTGRPVAPAIVWQSRITAPLCEGLKAQGLDDLIRQKTGLIIDPYFSGTKIRYLLDQHSGLRARAERGEVLFGTIDSFLVWRLTGGARHLTDVSNASRTLLLNIHTLQWDDELLERLGVPRAMLPEIVSSSEVYGETSGEWLGSPVPIAGVAGDQQAATFGQACFHPGMAKNTYGTGCFLLLNTGSQPRISEHRLLTTVGWSIGGQVTYCLEGAIFVAGAVVQWLRDGLGLFASSADVQSLAASVPDAGGVVFVPAFVGLGAPHWDPYARGTIFGISRATTAGHIARAALESIGLQTRDLIEAMEKDTGLALEQLRVDGGASVNDDLMQFQADIVARAVERPRVAETTALGAAYLAGLAVGYWENQSDVENNWVLERRFQPSMDAGERDRRYRRWQRAVERSLDWERT